MLQAVHFIAFRFMAFCAVLARKRPRWGSRGHRLPVPKRVSSIVGCLLLALLVSACQPLIRADLVRTTADSHLQLSLQPATNKNLAATEIFAKISPAVAFVETPTSTGSGVLIEHGYLLSNAHVVWPFNKVRVVFPDGSEYLNAPVFAWDLIADLALIGPIETKLKPAALVDSKDLPIGTGVYLIGYPAEVDKFPQPTITNGILSRVRTWETIKYSFLQVDATITGGQSGGVLVTQHGDIIGISTFYYDSFGLAGSVGDALPRLNAMLGNATGVTLDERRFGEGKGATDYTDILYDQWDVHRYILHEPVDTQVNLSVKGAGKPQLIVSDVSGRQIGATQLTAEQQKDTQLSFTVDAQVPYIVEVVQPSTNETPFILHSSHPLIVYPDPDDRGRLLLDKPILASLDTQTDKDYYTLDLKAGEIVQIMADSLRISPFITLRYESPTLEEIVADSRNGGGIFGNNAQMTYKAPQDGSYQLVVENDSYDGLGGYFLTVKTAAADAVLTKPTVTHSLLPTSFGRMAWYESKSSDFAVLYPVEWKQLFGTNCAPGATACFAGSTASLVLTQESLNQLPRKERNRAGYLQLLQDMMDTSSDGVKLEGVHKVTTYQKLEAAQLDFTFKAGRFKGSRFVYVDEEKQVAFNVTFVTLSDAYEPLKPLGQYIFDSFRYWNMADRNQTAVYHFDEARRLAAQKEYTAAIAEYTKSIALDPKSPEAYNARAWLYYNNGDAKLALADLAHAIDLAPQNGQYYASRATMRWQNGDFAIALEDVDRALALKDGSPSSLYNQRALIHASLAQYEAALADVEKIQQDASDELVPSVLDTRGFIYLKMGNFAKAKADYTAALAQDFRSPYVLLGSGLVSAQMGESEKARTLLKEGLTKIESLKIQHPDPQLADLIQMAKHTLEALGL